MKPAAPTTLTQWRKCLDKLLRQKTPLGLGDFPQLDEDIADAFAEGVAVAEYFDDTIRGELEDLGFPYQDLDDATVQRRFEESLAELEAQGYAGLGEDANGGRP
jgi:hypothetical protein